MCRQLGASRSGHYKWFHREETSEELENKQLASWITEYDARYKHILGYRRMANWINRDKGTHFSKRRIHRLMKILGIRSKIRKASKVYQGSTPQAIALEANPGVTPLFHADYTEEKSMPKNFSFLCFC